MRLSLKSALIRTATATLGLVGLVSLVDARETPQETLRTSAEWSTVETVHRPGRINGPRAPAPKPTKPLNCNPRHCH